MTSLVSVGVPTFNRPDGLKRLLACLQSQTYHNLEIIVSDNCSSDPEVERYMRKICQEDGRIYYFRQKENIGAVRNFEFVQRKAAGKYFFWAADDDICENTFVEKIVTTMESDPSIVLCGCDVESIDSNGDHVFFDYLNTIRPDCAWEQARRQFFRYPTSNIFFCIYGIYRNSILEHVDLDISVGWRGFLTNGEVPFLAQVSTLGRIVAIPKVLKKYRRHEDSAYSKEVSRVSAIDKRMIRLFVRYKLLKLSIFNQLHIESKFQLMYEVISSIEWRETIVGRIVRLISRAVKKDA